MILVAGANIAECAPITTDYLWQARENGAKLIVLDPRMTPIARNADLFIPVRSGGDIGVFNGMLHIMIERGWIDREFIAEHTTGFDAVEEAVRKYTPEYSAKIAGVPAEMIVKAAEMWGPAPTSFPVACARDRAPLERRRQLHGRDQPGGRQWTHRPRRLRLCHDYRPGQRPGRPRAGTEMRPAAGQSRYRQSRNIANSSPACGESRKSPSRKKGFRRFRSSRPFTTARSKD